MILFKKSRDLKTTVKNFTIFIHYTVDNKAIKLLSIKSKPLPPTQNITGRTPFSSCCVDYLV